MYEIGFIGFGEAASMFSKGLSVNGNVIIYAYDVNAKHEVFGPNIVRKAKENNVFLVNSLKSLVKKAKVIINLTSATYALQIAEDIVTHLDRKHLYIDMNSSSPMLQNKIHEVISRNALFVDGAVMESIPSYLHKVPINLSGPGAKRAEEIGESIGMNLKYISKVPGEASAIKMVRSIFMKGFTMLLLETLTAGKKFGVENEVLSSLEKSLQKESYEQLADRLIGRTAIHAGRRVFEMTEVVHTLKEESLNYVMAEATEKKLSWLNEKHLKELFNNESPNSYLEVLEAIYNKK